MSNGRLLTGEERKWLEDLARLLSEAEKVHGFTEMVKIREDLSVEAVRRLREIAGT